MSELVVFLPGRPPGPNARLHWRAAAKGRSEWRYWSKLATLEAMFQSDLDFPLEVAEVQPTFLVRFARRRDQDNLIASLKPLLDGLVDAGVVTDDAMDRLRLERPVIEKAKLDGVRLRVREVR